MTFTPPTPKPPLTSAYVPTVTRNALGNLRVYFNGVDVSTIRGVATTIRQFGSSEPFGDDIAIFEFNAITPFDRLGAAALDAQLTPFVDWATVELVLVEPNGTNLVLWQGNWSTDECIDSATGAGSAGSPWSSFQCMGALQLLSLRLQPPQFTREVVDIVQEIPHLVNAAINDFGLPLSPMATYLDPRLTDANPVLDGQRGPKTSSGIFMRQGGSWTSLQSHIQDILSTATVDPIPPVGTPIVDIVARPDGLGYWTLGGEQPEYVETLTYSQSIKTQILTERVTIDARPDGTVSAFGWRTPYRGSMANEAGAPVQPGDPVGPTPVLAPVALFCHIGGDGYWILTANGQVFCYNAVNYGQPYNTNQDITDFVDGDCTATGLGYWLIQRNGTLWTFGDARNLGHPGANVAALTAWHDVDGSHPDGQGYWTLDEGGAVNGYGQSNAHGNAPAGHVAIAQSGGGDGYWTVGPNGGIEAFGDAVFHGDALGIELAAPITGLAAPVAGSGLTGYWILGGNGSVFHYGDLEFYGSVVGASANWNQYTVSLGPGRTPLIGLKNLWAINWTVYVGAPGVALDLTRALQNFPNAFYGEGVDVNGCNWRNTKYPGQAVLDVPLWGRVIVLNDTGADVVEFQNQLIKLGYPCGPTATGTYDNITVNIVRSIQQSAGLTLTGTVTAQTWASVFDVGNVSSDTAWGQLALPGVDVPFFMPLGESSAVEPFLYNPNGKRLGPNPHYDPTRMRIETYQTFAANTSKAIGYRDARSQVSHYNSPGYSGTITLSTDPAEGSRYKIKAGDNIMVRGFRGRDPLLHVVSVQHDMADGDSLTSQLTVDEQGHDMISLGAIMSRDLTTNDPTKRQSPTTRAGAVTQDRKSLWDCENNCGTIPLFSVEANTWTVIRIPFGDSGSIAATMIKMTVPSTFSVALFDGPITPTQLQAIMPLGPLHLTAGGQDPWDLFPESSDLMVAWGEPSNAAGYYPYTAGSPGATVTGVMADFSTLYYESSDPPWVYLAIYSTITNTCMGDVSPAMTNA